MEQQNNIVQQEKEEQEKEQTNIIISDAEVSGAGQEQLRDIFIRQLILTMAVVTVFAVINIFSRETTGDFVSRFKSLSSGPTEKLVSGAVDAVMKVISR